MGHTTHSDHDAPIAADGGRRPITEPAWPGGGSAGQAKYAFAPRVLAVLGLDLVVFTSLHAALTYIVPF
ncbi:hypothetical protein [Sinosporangium siamense]|uniref:Uncharacterized protein n=1 Tax=Sinosporangium siamense TaxID=1367973 RepID=A0A919RIJ0_9ACTN|nr:hypothetical protein [Sinosporangium siamense]GII94283.1 hypothetical protein Ssi02_45140 [Sinosporangium siamense]